MFENVIYTLDMTSDSPLNAIDKKQNPQTRKLAYSINICYIKNEKKL